MKALGPQRLRMVLCFFLATLFVAAIFVAADMKAGMGIVLPCALGGGFLFACRTPRSSIT